MIHTWTSKNMWKSQLSFYCVGPRDGTRVSGLAANAIGPWAISLAWKMPTWQPQNRNRCWSCPLPCAAVCLCYLRVFVLPVQAVYSSLWIVSVWRKLPVYCFLDVYLISAASQAPWTLLLPFHLLQMKASRPLAERPCLQKYFLHLLLN